MEPHGGYLCRLDELETQTLVSLARQALEEDGQGAGSASLLLTALVPQRVLRIAYDGPFTYGRRGARWYEAHHALARELSKTTQRTVHAYVFDPEELEQVTSYGAGRPVGGERLRYEDAELPDDDDLDDRSFAKWKERWPLGHLAKVLGLTRADLIRLPRAQTALIDLADPGQDLPRRVMGLFPGQVPAYARPSYAAVGRAMVSAAVGPRRR